MVALFLFIFLLFYLFIFYFFKNLRAVLFVFVNTFSPTVQGGSLLFTPSSAFIICGLLLLLLSRFSRVRLCATPQMAAHQAPPSMGFSRQEYWSGCFFRACQKLLRLSQLPMFSAATISGKQWIFLSSPFRILHECQRLWEMQFLDSRLHPRQLLRRRE